MPLNEYGDIIDIEIFMHAISPIQNNQGNGRRRR